jgi:hypothetical protein
LRFEIRPIAPHTARVIPPNSSRPLSFKHLRFLAASTTCALVTFLLPSVPASAQVTITPAADVVHVSIDGQPYSDFIFGGGNAMKAYLYPLRSASGKLVTRKFPVEPSEGEPKDHPHHRGLWFAHENVNGTDVWNNETTYTKPNRGRIVVDKITDVQSGQDSGSFTAHLDWINEKGEKLVSEARKMTFRKTPTLRIIDVDVNLTAVTDVNFGDAKDGAFGLRVAAALEEPGAAEKGNTNQIPGTATIRNAEGVEHEKPVWGKYSNWIDYSGELDGEKLGIAVFENPHNTRRSRWHVRAYGLFAANPFGAKAFGDKSQDGSMPLKAGESAHFSYRVIIHPGDATSANIASLWDEYSKEAK